jgi:quercetin dioxygenase-like cupin family protein
VATSPGHVIEVQAPRGGIDLGRVIENRISGERIVVDQTSEQTGGRLLSFDLYLPPGGHVPAWHVHPIQEERFTVVDGRMRFRLGRRTILAGPGDTVLVPSRRPHWFGNSGPGPAHARVEVRPALRTEELFQASGAIGSRWRLRGTRFPRPGDLAAVLLEFQGEVGVPGVPAGVLRALLSPLAWLGRHRRRGPAPAPPAGPA